MRSHTGRDRMIGDSEGLAAFARVDESVYIAIARPHAAAPFGGVQGGAIAGLMASKIEGAAPEGFQPLSIRADFLRPTPLGEHLAVSLAPLQIGRRSALFEASVFAQGKQTARATMSLVLPTPVAKLDADFQLPPAPPFPDLGSLPRRKTGPAPHGGPWLMDVFDARQSEDGRMWFRWTLPLLPDGEGRPSLMPSARPTGRMASPAPVSPDLSRSPARMWTSAFMPTACRRGNGSGWLPAAAGGRTARASATLHCSTGKAALVWSGVVLSG